jgi:hypothetical protein
MTTPTEMNVESLPFGLKQAGLEIVALDTVRGYNDIEQRSTLRGRTELVALTKILLTLQTFGPGDALDCWTRHTLPI